LQSNDYLCNKLRRWAAPQQLQASLIAPNCQLLGGLLFAEVLFAFNVTEDTYHRTPTHNVDNSFNNAHIF
jgi:hypothetical protein